MKNENINTTPVHGPLSVTTQIIAYESGELGEDETIELFQHLIDSGLAWSLQGHYGRTAKEFIDNGYCTLKTPAKPAAPVEHTPIPWITDGRFISASDFRPGTGFIADTEISSSLRKPGESKANAEFICRAVNTHDKLLKALQAFVRATKDTEDSTIEILNREARVAIVDALTPVTRKEK